MAQLTDSDGSVIDEALTVVMRAPRTYTGEDIVEFHCHGGAGVLQRTLTAVFAAGARPALAGEFTRRAFLNGRLDLTQAEAVAELIDARTPQAAAAAARNLGGALSTALALSRSELIDIKALLEARIDFADEDIEFDSGEVGERLQRCIEALQSLVASHQRGKLQRHGARLAIAGRPNVGKSSLLNALLGHDRAIVTDIPGTTRDVVEETANFGGIPITLADTAGLRLSPADEVEKIGMERSRAEVEAADHWLLVVDGARPLGDEDRNLLSHGPLSKCTVVINKSDLPSQCTAADVEAVAAGCAPLTVSARSRAGLDELRSTVAGKLAGNDTSQVTIASDRQHEVLSKALRSCLAVGEGLARETPADVVAVDVQEALDYIAAATGEISGEDVLDRVFQRFCIGK